MLLKGYNDNREVKISPGFVKSIDGRRIVGICAVCGNLDDEGDRTMSGAFAKTIQESSRRFRHLWSHGSDGMDYGVTPPIAAIKNIQEVGRDALPQAVLDFAPEATGGLEVDRSYLNTERGNEIFEAYGEGIALEMSIGYVAIKSTIYKGGEAGRVSDVHYRDLIEVRLFDTSDVNWGMNSATLGAKSDERILEGLIARMKQVENDCLTGKLNSSILLAEFKALCAKLGALEIEQPADDESRAEPPPVERISLTQVQSKLREMELALVS
jgi:hypothetical protein